MAQHLSHTITNCRSLSLKSLASLVVQDGNGEALEELFSRTLFQTGQKKQLRITDYLQTLRSWASGRTWRTPKAHETADVAYNITLDKFSNLSGTPAIQCTEIHASTQEKKPKGPNCRLYWKAFHDRLEAGLIKEPPKSELEQEARATALLKGFIWRHFLFSLLEAERTTNDFWSRYNWSIGDRSISVWLPKSLKGTERRKWLEKNIKDPDPERHGERDRIQAIISHRLVSMAFVPLQENIGKDPTDSIIRKISGGHEFISSLARFVADEKSGDIRNQRRSIRKMGKDNLHQLVLRIFVDLEAGEYQDQQVASEFGLSKATFSRFAGSQWHASENKAIPDLWMNTAQVLSTQPDFREAAIEAGVWNEVEKTLKKVNRN